MTRSIRSSGSAHRALLLTLALAVPLTAAAAPTAQQAASAKQAFEAAERDYEVGRFEEAIQGYARAFELTGFPELLFNLGQAHRQLGRWDRAAFFYRRYLSRADRPKNKKLVEDLLVEVDQKADAERKAEAERKANAARRAEAAAAPSVPTEAFSPAPHAPSVAQSPPGSPVYQRWWFWAGIGAVVAAGATTYAVTSSPPPRQGTLGEVRF